MNSIVPERTIFYPPMADSYQETSSLSLAVQDGVRYSIQYFEGHRSRVLISHGQPGLFHIPIINEYTNK